MGIGIVGLRVGRSPAALPAAGSSGLDSTRFVVEHCTVVAVGSCFQCSSIGLVVVDTESSSFSCLRIG